MPIGHGLHSQQEQNHLFGTPIMSRQQIKAATLRALAIGMILLGQLQSAPPSPSESDDTNTIKIASLDWQPFTGKKLHEGGFMSIMLKEAFALKGYRVKISFMPWARVLKVVKNGEYHAGYPAYFSNERTKIYHMSQSIMSSPVHLCEKKGRGLAFDSLESLKPYKIGIVNGYLNAPSFDAADFLNKKPANHDGINIKKLMSGRLDLIVIDRFTANFLAQTSIPEAQGNMTFLNPALQEKSLHLMVSRAIDLPEQLLKDFEDGIKAIKANGRFQEILQQSGF